ncbi:hypothetical protein [Nocardia tengchongensis]|uniref:hypothetical protein n=1 Tax=Nocardia tengchongensis TaxID=2055889 RepID=UPI0036640993
MSSLTEIEARVLGTLSGLDPNRTLTVRQLCGEVGLTAESARRALRALSHSGFAAATYQNPPNWRATNHGRDVMSAPALKEYVRKDSSEVQIRAGRGHVHR